MIVLVLLLALVVALLVIVFTFRRTFGDFDSLSRNRGAL